MRGEIITLFLFAVVARVFYALPRGWPLVLIFAAMLGAMCIRWQVEHQWVSWLSPAFISALGPMVLAIGIGIIVGGIILKYWPKE